MSLLSIIKQGNPILNKKYVKDGKEFTDIDYEFEGYKQTITLPSDNSIVTTLFPTTATTSKVKQTTKPTTKSQNIITTIKQGNPFVQSTFKRKGKEYKLVHYIDEKNFSKTVSFPSDSPHLQSIFPNTKQPTVSVNNNLIKSSKTRTLLDDHIKNTTYELSQPILATNTNIKEITAMLHHLKDLTMSRDDVREGGYVVHAKMVLNSLDKSNKLSKTELIKMEEKIIFKQLQSMVSKNYDVINYKLYITHVDIIVSILPTKGGCENRCKTENFEFNEGYVKLINPKSKNNNCLIQCFIHSMKLKTRAESVRLKVGLIPNKMICIADINKISEFFQRSYILVNQEHKHLKSNKIKSDKTPPLQLFLIGEHYMYGEQAVFFSNCQTCGKRIREDNTTHKCNITNQNHFERTVKNNKIVKIKNIIEKKELNYDKVCYFDLETFQESNQHIPYACGYKHQGKYYQDYGQDCMDNFIDYIISLENTTITAYNASGFDSFFLIDQLTKKGRDIKITDIILSSGKLMSFKFGSNKVFDLYLFVMSSLDNACKDFKIENAKMKFDHSKMKTWDNTEQYKHEVEPYLKMDVLALEELFQVFNKMIYSITQVNITTYITCSHMAYAIWTSMIETNIEIPDIEKYNYIRQSIYGGRTTPHQKDFKSKHYDDVLSGKMKYDELIKTKEFLYNADATSLYPASMSGFELCKVAYPIGISRWSEKPQEEFNKKKIGFYEIQFIAPKDIRVPILPRKRNGGIEWSLFDGAGVYSSVDIENAIEFGYQITFINKCLVYDEEGDVFNKYIDMFYKMKADAEKENNQVKRSCGKLMLNSLYGKTMQRAIFNTTSIIDNYNDYLKFLNKFELKDFIVLNDNKLMVCGESKDKEEKITKPSQFGSLVTAYSRRIMLVYMKAIDPTLKSKIYTYTDTDSIHVDSDGYNKLKVLGYIKSKEDSQLGYLCSDIKNEGIIIQEKNLQPKCYTYEYIDNKNTLKIDDDSTMKTKGIPQRVLKSEYYKNEKPVKLEFDGLLRKHIKLTSKDSCNYFSIINNHQSRTFCKSTWKGMNLIDNEFFPFGFKKPE